MKPVSANFEFLGKQDAQLVRLGGLAERYFKDDPNLVGVELAGIFELIRKTRNEAGHPTDRIIEQEEADALLLLLCSEGQRATVRDPVRHPPVRYWNPCSVAILIDFQHHSIHISDLNLSN
jgi:hypothetical protein